MRLRLGVPGVVLVLLLVTSGCELLQLKLERRDGPDQRDDERGGGGGDAPPAAPPPSGRSDPQPSPRQQEPASERVHLLEARWRPLERVEERPPLPGLSATTATTISPVVYVQDVQGWLKRHPPGSPHYEALLQHEQLHARRQVAAGVDAWVQRYLRDREFMWAEEQRGWYVQIQRLQQAGFMVDPAAVARVLLQYRNLSGAMVGRDEALRWANDAVANRWTPPRD